MDVPGFPGSPGFPMSRQLRFYLLPSDADELISELRGHTALHILQERSQTALPIELDSPVQNSSISLGSEGATSIRCYLASSLDAHLDIEHYPRLGAWVIQPSSEAVEFSGCDFNGVTLMIGRLYVQTDVLIDGAIHPKRDEFVEWASLIFRWAKKRLRRDRDLNAYVGVAADAFRRGGGRFASLIRSDGQMV